MDWQTVDAARAAAHGKHGEQSIERLPAGDPRWLPILLEEVGELAAEIAPTHRRRELVDVLAVASAWHDATEPEVVICGDDEVVRLRALAVRMGDVAHSMTYDAQSPAARMAALRDLARTAASWADALLVQHL